jgi:hypothetical protein
VQAQKSANFPAKKLKEGIKKIPQTSDFPGFGGF